MPTPNRSIHRNSGTQRRNQRKTNQYRSPVRSDTGTKGNIPTERKGQDEYERLSRCEPRPHPGLGGGRRRPRKLTTSSGLYHGRKDAI